MKRNLILLSLCSIAALHYSTISADLVGAVEHAVEGAVDTTKQVAEDITGTGHAAEHTVVTEKVTTEPAVIGGEPAVVKTTVIEETAVPVEDTNVAEGTTEQVEHEGWFSRMWRNIFG
jgi:hypothetical protein